tara:strand:- start:424 stop:954 length:531 start_codon:yes stop_codon:yes gene_type:complete
MAIYWSSGSQLDYSNVVSWKTSVTGQQQSKANNQGSGGFAAVQGLNSISHAIKRSGNIVLVKYHFCIKGNANTDEARIIVTVDDNDFHGGAVGHGNGSSASQCRNFHLNGVGVFQPNDTNSHTYKIEWISSESGSTVTINGANDPTFWTQGVMELIECDTDNAAAGGNQGNSYGTP